MQDPKFLSNVNHIARFESKPYPAPQPANAVTLGFEKHAYEKIVGELSSNSAIVKAKAVIAVRELLVTPTKHIQCIAAGVTPALVGLLQADAANTLQLLSAREVGCRDILQHDGLRQLLHLLKHPNPAVKDAVYSTLCVAAGFECCKAAIVQQQGALGQLMRHAQHEEPQRAAQALDLVKHCTQMRHNQDALSNLIAVVQAVPVLAGMINSATVQTVQIKAIKLLAVLAATQVDARTQAVDCGCVPQLLKLLASDSVELACVAAEALMMITLAREGKVAAHEVQGTSVLVNLLMAWMIDEHQAVAASDEAESFRDICIVNVLQSLTNVAEYPPGREALQQLQACSLLGNLLHQLPDGRMPSELVQKAATQAIRLIGFHNWPQ